MKTKKPPKRVCMFCQVYFTQLGLYGGCCCQKCHDNYKRTGGHLRHREMIWCDVAGVNKYLLMPVRRQHDTTC